MLTPSLEDYLEEIYCLHTTRQPVRATELAARLNVSLPSVTKAMQKLNQAGYIEYKAYEAVTLTTKGREVGRYLVERAQILREFVKLVQADCNVSEEVESMEHYIAPSLVYGIARLVHYLSQEQVQPSYIRFTLEKQTLEPSPHVLELESIKQLRRFGGKRR